MIIRVNKYAKTPDFSFFKCVTLFQMQMICCFTADYFLETVWRIMNNSFFLTMFHSFQKVYIYIYIFQMFLQILNLPAADYFSAKGLNLKGKQTFNEEFNHLHDILL